MRILSAELFTAYELKERFIERIELLFYSNPKDQPELDFNTGLSSAIDVIRHYPEPFVGDGMRRLWPVLTLGGFIAMAFGVTFIDSWKLRKREKTHES